MVCSVLGLLQVFEDVSVEVLVLVLVLVLVY